MPAEPMTLMLRPRNFFLRNPALDVKPAFCTVPSGRGKEILGMAGGVDGRDRESKSV